MGAEPGKAHLFANAAWELPMLGWTSWRTPFLFFTGKGGVGKTTVAGAVCVALADTGRRVLLVSTDPASNLGDLLGTAVGPSPRSVPGVGGLDAMNLDPDAAAAAYRERVLGPYRGVGSAEEVRGIEEQLAGECTVEVAAFDQFTRLIVDPGLVGRYDHVVFDTAPTGHTLRLMNLPSAWSRYIAATPEGASCLGPRSGLEAQRSQYQAAVQALADPERTTLVLVSRPEEASLREAARAANELAAQGLRNQFLVVNGVLTQPLTADEIAQALAARQAAALSAHPPALHTLDRAAVPLVGADLTGIDALRALAKAEPVRPSAQPAQEPAPGGAAAPLAALDDLVEELAAAGPSAVLVMGKGGVGKTTIAAAVAVGLAQRGHRVHLSTTDPAGRPADILGADTTPGLTLSRIDPATELAAYTSKRMHAARHLDPQRLALLAEDLRSPCTEEIAVFSAFSALLAQARDHFVVIDTAPSGHTLRLLDLTGSYHRQVMSGAPDIPGRVTTPLMRLQDAHYSRIVIVTLPEATPVSEATALQDDLHRAGIEPFGWVVNAALTGSGTHDPLLTARAALEQPHLARVRDQLATRAWLVPWHPEALIGQTRLAALSHA